jgi:hypothetical protein
MSRTLFVAVAAILVLAAGAILTRAYFSNIGGFETDPTKSRLREEMDRIASKGGLPQHFRIRILEYGKLLTATALNDWQLTATS